MNVYDFDKTIYLRDSTADFIKYNIRLQPKMLRHAPKIIGKFIVYLFHKCTLTEFKNTLYPIFLDIPDLDQRIRDFWDSHFCDIKPWYKSVQEKEDVIISASPHFIVNPACERLGISHVIASRVDTKTFQYIGVNCNREEKVRRFREEYPDAEVDNAFSDSLSDTPMCRMAKQAYLVKGNTLLPWPEDNK